MDRPLYICKEKYNIIFSLIRSNFVLTINGDLNFLRTHIIRKIINTFSSDIYNINNLLSILGKQNGLNKKTYRSFVTTLKLDRINLIGPKNNFNELK
jgi:GTP:adenosylcobinamide-phosphate guanylyltransferase